MGKPLIGKVYPELAERNPCPAAVLRIKKPPIVSAVFLVAVDDLKCLLGYNKKCKK